MKHNARKGNVMITRLRWKSIAVMMGIVAIFVVGILTMLYLSSQASFERRSMESLRSALKRAESRSEERADRSSRFNRLPALTPLAVIRIDAQGKASLVENQIYNLEDASILSLAESLYAQNQLDGIASNYSLRYLGEMSDSGCIYALADISIEMDALRAQLFHSLSIGFVTLMIFFAVCLLLAQWMVRPVAQAWEDQRRFIADASHELKTPLTVVLANTDMLLESQAVTEEKNLRRLDHIKAESQRMRGLVESLLTLARSDSRKETPVHLRLCLSELVTYSLLSLEPAIFETGRSLEDAIAPDLYVMGDADKLRQLVDILLDNARKYSPPGSVIHVTLAAGPKRENLLSVRSAGAPLPTDEQEAIFRRFYRADPSRGKAAGYGLGLSIAQTIVTEHKGRISVRSEDDCSNTFTVVLPKA
ncbi:MAG: HAMP domain-containing histidine kinase [Clostridia bacterium]|nr:HAMP domain-containing histidine kinase [Clostridia bacterium]